jgi:hypothetical protein
MDFLFFSLYNFFEASPFNKWKSEWKSSASLSILIGYIFVSLFVFYAAFINSEAIDFFIDYKIPVVIYVIIYVTIFIKYHLNDYWKVVIKKKDYITKKKKIYLYSSLFFLICINSIVFSFYFLFKY